MLVAGGLLDAATDSIYLVTEDFEAWKYKMAATAFLSLPIVIVLLSFWALVFIDYKKSTWRYILLPIEGPLKLLLLLCASFTAFAWVSATVTMKVPYAIHRLVTSENRLTNWFSELYKKAYVNTTVQTKMKRKRKGRGVEEQKVTTKYYHDGLTNLLAVRCFFFCIMFITLMSSEM